MKFKVGDSVRVVKNICGFSAITVGEVYQIESVGADAYKINGGWNMFEYELELADQPKASITKTTLILHFENKALNEAERNKVAKQVSDICGLNVLVFDKEVTVYSVTQDEVERV